MQVKKTNTVLSGHQILFPAWIGGQIFEAKTTIYNDKTNNGFLGDKLNTTQYNRMCLVIGRHVKRYNAQNSCRETNFIYDLLKIRERKCGLNVSSYLFQTDRITSKKEY